MKPQCCLLQKSRNPIDYVDWMYKRELTISGIDPLPPLPPVDMEIYVDDDLEKLPPKYAAYYNNLPNSVKPKGKPIPEKATLADSDSVVSENYDNDENSVVYRTFKQ